MSFIELDDVFDDYEGKEENEKITLSSDMSEKALYTERRRKIEERIEMIRINREIGLDDDFMLSEP
jgi:hypothetical protein